jgi:hypothetical protein
MLSWFEIGKIIVQVGTQTYKFKNKRDLERHCNQLVNEYELNYNATVEEFRSKFEKLPAHEKTIFYRCYPDIEEYLDSYKNDPGRVVIPLANSR